MQKLKRFISLLCVCFIMATLTFTVSCKDDKVSCDEAFKILKQSMRYTSNVENYEKGFTCEWCESYESVSTLIESKSDLGDTDPDGEPWASEEAKKAFLDECRVGYEESKSFSEYRDKASYDLAVESGSLSYNYYVLKLDGMTASNCKYAYVNGTKVESGEEMVFVDGQTNYLVYITE